MQSAVNITRDQDKLLLKPSGNIVASTVESVRDIVRPAVEESTQGVVLDLGDVSQLDSLGVSLVVGLFKSCRSREVDFRIEGASADLMRVFRLFRLDHYFSISEA
jgi:anti-sigma B factor antagonist